MVDFKVQKNRQGRGRDNPVKPVVSKFTGREIVEPMRDERIAGIFAFLKGAPPDAEPVDAREFLIRDPKKESEEGNKGKGQVWPQDLLEGFRDLPPDAFKDAHRSLARGSRTVFTPASLPAISEEPAPAPESERKFSK